MSWNIFDKVTSSKWYKKEEDIYYSVLAITGTSKRNEDHLPVRLDMVRGHLQAWPPEHCWVTLLSDTDQDLWAVTQ